MLAAGKEKIQRRLSHGHGAIDAQDAIRQSIIPGQCGKDAGEDGEPDGDTDDPDVRIVTIGGIIQFLGACLENGGAGTEMGAVSASGVIHHVDKGGLIIVVAADQIGNKVHQVGIYPLGVPAIDDDNY